MSVTLHTDLGDIKIEIDCENVKKPAYNFLALCASGYYDNTLIHRNIKGFMVQMGDSTGTGKGGMSTGAVSSRGSSIWNNKFEDEITYSMRVRTFICPLSTPLTCSIPIEYIPSFQAGFC
jgi:peptidyl-prolyl cis-trans isomerase-like 3